MSPRKKRVDRLRITGIIILFLGIIYFYFNLFFPTHIPFVLKFGIVERPINILVLGTDVTINADTKAKNVEKGRSDSIMLMHFDPLKNKINLVSIPRDAYVNIPGYGYMKINAAFVLGGEELTEKTIEQLFGINIDYYIAINTKGIVKLVDLVGGITVDIDKDLYYVDKAQGLFINLKQGRRTLSGKQAEGFVRFRHDSLGDFGRIQRQQQFFNALASRIANPASFIKAPFIMGLIHDHVQSNLSLKRFIMLANNARMMPKNHIKSATLPGTTEDNQAGSVVIINMPEAKKIIQENF